jgi:hypothetical protein
VAAAATRVGPSRGAARPNPERCPATTDLMGGGGEHRASSASPCSAVAQEGMWPGRVPQARLVLPPQEGEPALLPVHPEAAGPSGNPPPRAQPSDDFEHVTHAGGWPRRRCGDGRRQQLALPEAGLKGSDSMPAWSSHDGQPLAPGCRCRERAERAHSTHGQPQPRAKKRGGAAARGARPAAEDPVGHAQAAVRRDPGRGELRRAWRLGAACISLGLVCIR